MQAASIQGQPMFLNYTSSNRGINLYHLVLIGEEGSGNIDFMLKSQFGNTSLTPVTNQTRVLPNNPADISYISNNATLENAQLTYTTNNWNSTATVDMTLSNKTCWTTIPGQNAAQPYSTE